MMSIPGMRDRTIPINSMSKTYRSRVGEWVGFLLVPKSRNLSGKFTIFFTVGAAAPLQQAGVTALASGPVLYRSGLRVRRQRICC